MALLGAAACSSLQAPPGLLLVLPAALHRLRHCLLQSLHANHLPAGGSACSQGTWSTDSSSRQQRLHHRTQQPQPNPPHLQHQLVLLTGAAGWHAAAAAHPCHAGQHNAVQQAALQAWHAPASTSSGAAFRLTCSAIAAALQSSQAWRPCASSSQHRSFHASSPSPLATEADAEGQLPPGGPERAKLRAVPFLVSRDAAERAFRDYHSHGMLVSRQAPAAQAPKEAYLPFWVGSARVRTKLKSAEVGNDVLVNRYNPATRRYEPQWDTVWTRVALDMGWEQEYAADMVEMQLYASWKYPRRDIQPLAPGEHVEDARPITPSTMEASDGSGTRKVGPFNMTPDVARRLLRGKVEAAERRAAEDALLTATGAKHVRFLDMELEFVGAAGPLLSPLYAPVYVFSWMHTGVKIRTFVSGVDASKVTGSQTLDETKVATTVTTLVTGALFWSGAVIVLGITRFFYLGFLLPLVASWLGARFWPIIRNWFQEATTSAEAAWERRGSVPEAEAEWDAEFVRGYERYERTRRREQEQQQRQQQWQAGGSPFGWEDFQEAMRDPMGWFQRRAQQQQQQQQQGWQRAAGGGYQQQQQWQRQQQRQEAPRGPPGDPLGYYQTLGVSKTATTAEIQAAFRGKALQHHPDRYTAEADKKAATARFQKITEAFQVLRDKNKRSQYDAGVYNG